MVRKYTAFWLEGHLPTEHPQQYISMLAMTRELAMLGQRFPTFAGHLATYKTPDPDPSSIYNGYEANISLIQTRYLILIPLSFDQMRYTCILYNGTLKPFRHWAMDIISPITALLKVWTNYVKLWLRDYIQ